MPIIDIDLIIFLSSNILKINKQKIFKRVFNSNMELHIIHNND